MNDNREMIVLNGEQIDELVRCKDCKWYRDYSEYCDKWGDVFVYWSDHSPVPSNGYCYMGERKDEVE